MPYSPGHIAYQAYFDYSKGKSLISGARLPKWEDQSEEIKKAWEAAANSVIAFYTTTKA